MIGFDADKSYPLGSDYLYVAPVQPPINPNYFSYQQMQQSQSSAAYNHTLNNNK